MPNLWTTVRQMDPPPPIRVCATDTDFDDVVGTGDPTATVHGTASDLRLRLWGRPATHQLDLDGDISAFEAWAASSPTGPID
jgi:hypothetical protein